MPGVLTYTDFLIGTKVAKITSPNEILNEAQRNTYLLRDMLSAQTPSKIVRAGQRIKDTIKLSQAGSFSWYVPNATFTPRDRDTLVDIFIDWRFAKTDYAYSDEIIALNEGTSEDVYVNLKHSKQQDAAIDMMEGLEDSLWARPVFSTMEQGMGEDPPMFSVPVFVTESGQGFNGSWGNVIMGLDSSVEERWRNQVESYDATAPLDEALGILPAFDAMWLKVKFESPDTASQYWEDDRLRAMKILTNRDGHVMYKRALRAGNDRFVSPQDPAYNEPRYNGIPVKYIATLDTAPLTPTSAVPWAAGEPRFYWLNCYYLMPVFHPYGWMEQVGPVHGGIQQPFTNAVYFRSWLNLFCRSRQRQGMVIPAS